MKAFLKYLARRRERREQAMFARLLQANQVLTPAELHFTGPVRCAVRMSAAWVR